MDRIRTLLDLLLLNLIAVGSDGEPVVVAYILDLLQVSLEDPNGSVRHLLELLLAQVSLLLF